MNMVRFVWLEDKEYTMVLDVLKYVLVVFGEPFAVILTGIKTMPVWLADSWDTLSMVITI